MSEIIRGSGLITKREREKKGALENMCSRRVSLFCPKIGHSSESGVEGEKTQAARRSRVNGNAKAFSLTPSECMNLPNHFSGSARERHRIIGPESVEITYSVRDLPSTITQSHLSSPSLSLLLLLLLLHPRDPLPTRSAIFCSFNKRTEGKRWRFVGRVDQCQGGLGTDRVSDCFDGQTLRFFPLPRRLYIILLFAPEIRSRLFLFHRPVAILPHFGIITILRYSWNDYCLSILCNLSISRTEYVNHAWGVG